KRVSCSSSPGGRNCTDSANEAKCVGGPVFSFAAATLWNNWLESAQDVCGRSSRNPFSLGNGREVKLPSGRGGGKLSFHGEGSTVARGNPGNPFHERPPPVRRPGRWRHHHEGGRGRGQRPGPRHGDAADRAAARPGVRPGPDVPDHS